MDEILIIKRGGEEEEYEERKVYASVYAAALICQHGEKKAEKIAKEVSKAVTSWLSQQSKKSKERVTSLEIREQIIKFIQDKEVSTIYIHYRDMC